MSGYLTVGVDTRLNHDYFYGPPNGCIHDNDTMAVDKPESIGRLLKIELDKASVSPVGCNRPLQSAGA